MVSCTESDLCITPPSHSESLKTCLSGDQIGSNHDMKEFENLVTQLIEVKKRIYGDIAK